MSDLASQCRSLRDQHVRGRPLVLPNAWDAASARAVVAAGFSVVATTSGGVAAMLGYEDHEDAPVNEMLAAAIRIVRSVDVPVTVDFEAGYGLEPDDLADRLKTAHVAGINLEDTDHSTGSLVPTARQAERLAAVRESAEAIGYPLVLNARIDVFLSSLDRSQDEVAESCVERARAYLEAGVDCVYPIFLREPGARREVLAAIDGAVNILAMPGTGASIGELASEGVARVSYGTSLHRTVMAKFNELLAGIA